MTTATTIPTQTRTSHAVAAVVATLTVVASVASVALTFALIHTATEMEREIITAQAVTPTDR